MILPTIVPRICGAAPCSFSCGCCDCACTGNAQNRMSKPRPIHRVKLRVRAVGFATLLQEFLFLENTMVGFGPSCFLWGEKHTSKQFSFYTILTFTAHSDSGRRQSATGRRGTKHAPRVDPTVIGVAGKKNGCTEMRDIPREFAAIVFGLTL